MSESPTLSVAVIGAGIAGLTAAFELLERARARGASLEIAVFESSPRPGGNIRTERGEGYICEWGPEGFLDSAPETLSLIHRIGLDSQLIRARSETNRRYIYHHGRLRLVPLKPPAFLASDILPARGRLRVLAEPFIPARRGDEDESVFDFAARRIGRAAAGLLVDSMVSGVYAGDARRLSLPAAFPRMREMEREHGGLFRAMIARKREARRSGRPTGGPSGPAGTLTSFANGMDTLIDGLVQAIGPERIRLHRSVLSIQSHDGGFDLRLADGVTARARAVVLATPAPRSAQTLDSLSPGMAASLRRIPFAGIIVLGLGFRRQDVAHPIDGFGFLIPRSETLKTLGALWPSATFPGRAPEGAILVRAMIGGATWPEALDWDDRQLMDLCMTEIGPILGIRGAPAWSRVFRFPAGIAQYNLGHRDILADLERGCRQIPGIFLAGTSYKGIAVNTACAAAPKLAEAVVDSLESGHAGPTRVF